MPFEQAKIASLLLLISGQDPVEIDRKNRPSVTVRLSCRIVISSNELPRIADASGALAGRFVLVRTRQSFHRREDTQLQSRLLAELPGMSRGQVRRQSGHRPGPRA